MEDFMDERLKDKELTLQNLKEGLQEMEECLKLDLDPKMRKECEMIRDQLQELIDIREELDALFEEQEEIRQDFRKSVAENRGIRKRVGRNAPCPCGSGLKFKKCCGKG